jgi:hypothetical protein
MVQLSPSRVISEPQPPDIAGVPVVRAFGDPDDHLRWTVLLAHHLGGRAAPLRELAEVCQSPRSGWQQRLDALASLLRQAPPPAGQAFRAVLVDLDALDPGPLEGERLWDDRHFFRQRHELLELLLDAVVHQQGWLLVRPRPSSSISLRVAPLLPTEEVESLPDEKAPTALEALLDCVSPESRPVLAWLERAGVMGTRDMERLLEAAGPEGFEETLLDIAYDALPVFSRDAALRLSVLRGPQPVAEDIQARAIEGLVYAGFLQPSTEEQGHRTLQMPRAVRLRLLPLARLAIPEQLILQHQWWGSRPLEGLPLAAQLETHFHAVQGGQLEEALRTARYYASDLRELAFRRSHEEHYSEAAEVYRRIVEDFDPEDAYAWEYLGYNLALACGSQRPSAQRDGEIRRAYARALALDRGNPLYHGRLLGYRASAGEDVRAEFHHALKRYLTNHSRQPETVSYFAEPVLRGMQRGGRPAWRQEIIERWGTVLRRSERLRPMLEARA